jgi:4-amino-4-deoxy-L-arabinose transferase-like glycosyltransferase
MPRVLHWVQNQSLQHYPAVYDVQNVRPYWAEIAILNLRVLSGNDHSASLVQWFSFVGSMIGAAGIASVLGGRRRAQWLAAIFVLSIPMSLLQSTTPKNDVVSTFWVISLAYFIVVSMKRELTRVEFVGMSLSFGLGILTKGTVFPFVAPLLTWFFLTRLLTKGLRRTFIEGLVLVVFAAVLNGVFLYRNVVTYGGPYGSAIPVRIIETGLG